MKKIDLKTKIETIEEAILWVKRYGKRVGKEFTTNEKALKIGRMYKFFAACTGDKLGQAMFIDAINEYIGDLK